MNTNTEFREFKAAGSFRVELHRNPRTVTIPQAKSSINLQMVSMKFAEYEDMNTSDETP